MIPKPGTSGRGTSGRGTSGPGTPEPVPLAPVLRIVRGDPTAEELAALVAVLLSPAAAGPAGEPPPASAWAAPRAALRRQPTIGRGAWVASGREPGVRTRTGW